MKVLIYYYFYIFEYGAEYGAECSAESGAKQYSQQKTFINSEPGIFEINQAKCL